MMKKMAGLLAAAFAWLALAGCAGAAQSGALPGASTPPGRVAGAAGTAEPPAQTSGQAPQEAPRTCVFERLADDAITAMALPQNAGDFEKVKAAFRYVIANTHYVPYDVPELTGSWRWADVCGRAPAIWQVMAFSPLKYGIGSCENYACALMVLLGRMGFDTRYVSGLTFSVQGTLVNHAWAMVAVGGNWYHIDPQLEDNVQLDGMLFYRYYLKADAEFAASHVWGARLENPDDYALALPACERSAPAPAAEPIEKTPKPALDEALAAAERLRAAGTDCGLEPLGILPPFPLPEAGVGA